MQILRLSWLEHCPVHQMVVGLIPSQGKHLDYGFNPWSSCVQEATNRCFSLTSLPLSLKSMNISLSEDLKKDTSIKDFMVEY